MVTIRWGNGKIEIEGLSSLAALLGNTPPETIGTQPVAAVVEADPLADVEEKPKAKRGRPAKVEKVEEAIDADDDPLAELESKPKKEKAAPKTKVTSAEIMKTATGILRAGKRDELLAVLADFGVDKPSSLKPEQYDAFLAAVAEIET
jgi:hypothetical protein